MDKTELLQLLIDENNEYVKAHAFYTESTCSEQASVCWLKMLAIRDFIEKTFGHNAYEYGKCERCTLFGISFYYRPMEVRKDGVEV